MPVDKVPLSNNTKKMLKVETDGAIKYASQVFHVEQAIIKAIISAESGGCPHAIRYEPGLKRAKWYKRLLTQKEMLTNYSFSSVGLMQQLYGMAKYHGFKGHVTELNYPRTSVYYGTKHLSYLLKKYPDIKDAISAYNAGRPLKKKDGTYWNPGNYVEKVHKKYLYYKKVGTSKAVP